MPVDASLLTLQRHDSAIDAVTRKLGALPEAAAVAAAEARRAEAQARLDELRASLDSTERRRKKLEDEATVLEGRLASVNQKLFGGGVSSPRELSALQADAEMLSRQHAELEDRMLEEMMSLEEAAPEREGLEAELAAIDSELARCREARDSAMQELEAQLGLEREARAGAAAAVEGELLGLYERVRAANDGVGVAELAAGRCQGCHLELTPAERVEAAETPVPRCPNCTAILVAQE